MIEFRSMTFGYGKKPLFSGLDLRLETGSIYGLLGLNGAGKTSLLKLGAGALRPQGGSIEVFGRNPGQREAAVLADLYFVPEDPWVPALTQEAWLSRFAVFRPAFRRDLFKRLSDELCLEEDKVLSKYSYGQRKKFALAAALASGARTLLLDEPTNGLDIPSKAQLRRVLAEASNPDQIVVVSTHQVRDLENLIDPVVVVHGGKVVFNLRAEEIGERLAGAHLKTLEGAPVVYAEKDAVGWSALLARGSALEGLGADLVAPDLELVFDAAIAAPDRLRSALAGEALVAYDPDRHQIAKEASK